MPPVKLLVLSGTGINPYAQNFNDANVLTNSGWTAYSVSGDKLNGQAQTLVLTVLLLQY